MSPIPWLSGAFRRTDYSKLGYSRRGLHWLSAGTAAQGRRLPMFTCPLPQPWYNPANQHITLTHKNVKSAHRVPSLSFASPVLSQSPCPVRLTPCLPCANSASLCTPSRLSPAVGKHKNKPRGMYGTCQTCRAGRTVGRYVLYHSPSSCLGHTFAQQRRALRKDVINQLKSVISYSDARLTMEERNLLSIAYKHVTGTLRTSWRTVEGLE